MNTAQNETTMPKFLGFLNSKLILKEKGIHLGLAHLILEPFKFHHGIVKVPNFAQPVSSMYEDPAKNVMDIYQEYLVKPNFANGVIPLCYDLVFKSHIETGLIWVNITSQYKNDKKQLIKVPLSGDFFGTLNRN